MLHRRPWTIGDGVTTHAVTFIPNKILKEGKYLEIGTLQFQEAEIVE